MTAPDSQLTYAVTIDGARGLERKELVFHSVAMPYQIESSSPMWVMAYVLCE